MAGVLEGVEVLKGLKLLRVLYCSLRGAQIVFFADIKRYWHFADLINRIKRRFHVSWIRPILDILLKAISFCGLKQMVCLLD